MLGLESVARCPLCDHQRLKILDSKVSLCGCEACGFRFRNPRPSECKVFEYYSQYDQYDAWLSNEKGRDALWRRRLEMVKQYGRQGCLLDVGTGIGQFLSLAREHFEVEGTEVSLRAIELAQTKYGLSIHRGPLEEVDLGERRFNVVTLFHVLEHVHDPRKLLLRCRELTTPTGIVVVAIPNEIYGWKRLIKTVLASLGWSVADASKQYGLRPITLDSPGEEIHLSHFTRRTIHLLFELCGLRVFHETVDPSHASSGVRQAVFEGAFRISKLLHDALGLQVGDAIWLAAERSHVPLEMTDCLTETRS